MRAPSQDMLKLGVTAALLGTASLLGWAGLAATLVTGGYARYGHDVASPAAYWVQTGFMAFGMTIVTAIAALLVWVLIDDPKRTVRADA